MQFQRRKLASGAKAHRKNAQILRSDVCDAELFRKIFRENHIGCVIHFAGLKAVGESVSIPWKYYENSLNATLVLTKVMNEVGVKSIIFSPSATVYTADNEMPLKETSRTGNCTDSYSWTKYMTKKPHRYVPGFLELAKKNPDGYNK